jgi:branched-chain amino acid transport system permease protein
MGSMPGTDVRTVIDVEGAVAQPAPNGGGRAAGLPAATGRNRTLVRRIRLAKRATPLQTLVSLGIIAGFFLLPDDQLYAGSNALAAGIIGLGLLLPIAFLREMPLNGAGLAGLAAYSFSHLASQGVIGTPEGIAVALGTVVLVSVIGGLASLVVTGLYFVVASLVIQAAIEKVVFSIPGITGGAAGWAAPQPNLTGWFNTTRCVYLIMAIVTAVIFYAVSRLRRSRFGLHATLVGHVPEGSSAVGVRNWEVKLSVFAISGLIIGMGGCLTAFANGTPPATPKFGLIYSVVYLAIPIASGMRDLAAVLLMGAAFNSLPIILEPWNIAPNTLTGIIIISAALLARHGDRLTAEVRRRLRRITRRGSPAAAVEETVELSGAAVAMAAAAPNGIHHAAGNGGSTVAPRRSWAPTPPVAVPTVVPRSVPAGLEPLEGRDIVVDFGGIRAVDNVSIRLEPGRRLGIIGANGAGKTTLFNALTGFVPLHQGRVTLGEHDITHWAPYVRARSGIRRTFQIPRLVDILTVEQNVMCGYGHGDPLARRERVDMLLERFGVAGFRAMPVAALPFGVRREVELVRALARAPHVLMLDEPVSGLEDEEAEKLRRVLLELQAAEGWGLIVIEHDLKFITGVAEHMMVMEDGRLVVEGPTHEVLKQPEVRRVYLGELVSA